MDTEIKDKFSLLWRKYFNNAELPVVFYYTNDVERVPLVKPGSVNRCVIGALSKVREGESLCFDVDSVGCPGGKRYLGFKEEIMPDFKYFLSCGIPGELEGERYKKSPELVEAIELLVGELRPQGRLAQRVPGLRGVADAPGLEHPAQAER